MWAPIRYVRHLAGQPFLDADVPAPTQREVSATQGTNDGQAYCQGGARGRAAQGAARPAWRATSSAGITGGGCAMKLPISLILVLALATPSQARWKPEYQNQPADVQEWYRNAEVTEAAQPRFPFKKCCDNA